MKVNLVTPAVRRLLLSPSLTDNQVSPVQRIGGKCDLVSSLNHFTLLEIGDYFEPFMGGGSMFFSLKKENRINGTAYLGDTDVHLVNFMQVLQRESGKLAAAAYGVYERHGRGDRELFTHVVDRLLNSDSGFEQAVAYYVRDRLVDPRAALDYERDTAFSPSRAVQKGLSLPHIRRLPEFSKLLEDAVIQCCDYKVLFEKAANHGHDAFVFSDFPYLGRDEELYGGPFDFDSYAVDVRELAQSNNVMITLDAAPESIERLNGLTRIYHYARYDGSQKNGWEQVAVNYDVPYLASKVGMLGWTTLSPAETPTAANENFPPASTNQPTEEAETGSELSVSAKPSKQKETPDRNSDQWFTPYWLLNILYAIHGIDKFDLDPCSPPEGVAHTRAKRRFCIEHGQDGLKEDWKGNVVFMNPPYGRGIGKWVSKARQEVEKGNAKLIIGLLPAKTDPKWWHRNVPDHAGIWHLEGRPRFSNAASSGTFASALVFWGDASLFEEAWLDGFSCLDGMHGSLEGYWVPPQHKIRELIKKDRAEAKRSHDLTEQEPPSAETPLTANSNQLCFIDKAGTKDTPGIPHNVDLHIGDCVEVVEHLKNEGIVFDAIITDPPYESGYMGKDWDSTGIAHSVEAWKKILQVLKPGGFVASFGSARLFHRLAVAIEDAGVQTYPFLSWEFDTGLPKAMNVANLFDRDNMVEREIIGFKKASGYCHAQAAHGQQRYSKFEFPQYDRCISEEAQKWEGYYYGVNSLKPDQEPIYLGRKPIEQKRVIDNIRTHGVGALNIGALRSRNGGKWPSTRLCHKKTSRREHGTSHPTVKPVPLMEDLISLACPEGGLVLDPFAGTGTTGLACANLGRACTLIEKEVAWREVILKRLAENK